MRSRTFQAWLLTAGLTVFALIGLSVARSAHLPQAQDHIQPEADPCFRYGRLECCIRESE